MDNIEETGNGNRIYYLDEYRLKQLVNETIQQYAGLSNLDNGICDVCEPCGKENEMASGYRKTYYYNDEYGNRQTIRFNGQNEAETDLKFQNFIRNPKGIDGDIPFREFVEKEFKPWSYLDVAPTTIESRERYINGYILPYFGDMTVLEANDEIKIIGFNTFMANAKDHGYKQNLCSGTIDRVDALLKQILRYAVKKHRIEESAFDSSEKKFKNHGKKSQHHTAMPDTVIDEIKRKLPLIENDNERCFIGLIAYTGMRPEEALGLQWDDLHLDEGYGEIKRAVTYPDKNHPYIGETKTQLSNRTFVIPSALAALLEKVKDREGYILHGKDARAPLCHSSSTRVSQRAHEFLGIKGQFSNYDFRTTFATQLKESGMPIAMAADMMGHCDTRMMQKVYAPSRHEGVLKQKEFIEQMNQKYA